MLATFVLLGHWFEMRARGGANDAIRALLDLAPPKARRVRDGEPVEVPTAEVQVGDLLLIRPGSKVPVDAASRRARARSTSQRSPARACPCTRARRRSSSARRSTRTAPCAPAPPRSASDTALAQIVKLVQEAQNSKAPGAAARRPGRVLARARRARRRRAHVPRLVLRSSGATSRTRCCSPSRSSSSPARTRSGWRRRRRSWSAPARRRARDPVQERDRARAGRGLDTVVFDKTGTLTRGEPEVVAVATADGVDEDELLRLVAAAERDSEHPLARGDRQRRVRRAELAAARDRAFEAVPGARRCWPRSTANGSPSATPGCSIARASPTTAWARRADELAGQGRTSVQVAHRRQGRGRHRDRRRRRARPPPTAVAALRELGVRAGDALRRQPGHRPNASPPSSASTRSSPRCCPPTRPPRSPSSKRRAARSRWSATASTTPPRSPRPTSASPSAPAPTSPSRPPTSC